MIKQTLLPLMLVTTLLSCNQKNSADSSSSDTTQTSSNASIQDEISITDLKPASKDYTFPLVQFAKNKIAEDKINTFLQLENLKHLPGVYKKTPFETLIPDEGISGTTNFHQWKRIATIPNVLSLLIKGEYTGAYSEDYTSHYNFDARTGNKILSEDLFTENGLAALGKTLNQQVKKTIEDHLAELKKPGTSKDLSKEEKDAQLAMYKECLAGALDFNIEYYSFYFSNDSIVFERERCSTAHALDGLDDLNNFDIPISFAEIKKYLSPYGENLISGSGQAIATPSPEGKLYKGFIDGKYPIGAMIRTINKDGSFTMLYWYDKSKTPIEWSGTYSNQHFSMTEGDAAQIEADWKDNKITGTWTDLKKKQPLKLELEAY